MFLALALVFWAPRPRLLPQSLQKREQHLGGGGAASGCSRCFQLTFQNGLSLAAGGRAGGREGRLAAPSGPSLAAGAPHLLPVKPLVVLPLPGSKAWGVLCSEGGFWRAGAGASYESSPEGEMTGQYRLWLGWGQALDSQSKAQASASNRDTAPASAVSSVSRLQTDLPVLACHGVVCFPLPLGRYWADPGPGAQRSCRGGRSWGLCSGP